MKIQYTTFSEAGVRRTNQDVCRVVGMPAHDRTLLVVCDGICGHAMGDVADVIKFLCEKNSTDNYTGILAEII